mmetsp:Transcript_43818/g.124093  ORF Transcript_43818/g.124093 Transcript_43818/m.124093 type:complete len:90 (+) Transcript_43818:378-647(+)
MDSFRMQHATVPTTQPHLPTAPRVSLPTLTNRHLHIHRRQRPGGLVTPPLHRHPHDETPHLARTSGSPTALRWLLLRPNGVDGCVLWQQ